MLGTALKRWNWLDDGLIPAAGILMSASWVYPLFISFFRSPISGARNPGFSFWLCVAILTLGFFAGRMASQNRMGAVIVVIGGLATILITLMLTVPSEGKNIDSWFIDLFRFLERARETGEILPLPLVVIALTVLLWAKGIRLAGIDRDGVTGIFFAGIISLGGLIFINEVSGGGGGASFLRELLSGLAPLFLLAIPVALLLAILAPALGDWAHTASEVAVAVGVVFINTVMPAELSRQPMFGWLLLFLASGLAALSLVGVSMTLREQQRLTGLRLRIDRYWVGIMLGIIGLLLVLGLAIGQIVAPTAILRLLGVLRPIWWVIRQVLLYVILIFAYLFFSLIEPLLAEMENRPPRDPQTLFSPMEAETMEELAREPAQISPLFGILIQILLIVGLFAVVAMLFYILARRVGKSTQIDDVLETRETVWSPGLIQEQIRNLLDGLRWGRKPPMFDELGPPDDPRRVVRELYQKILAQAIQLQTPRPKGQTPETYGTTLARLSGGEEIDIRVLTEVYDVARYGTEPPTPEQVEAARQAFGRIDIALQKKKPLL